MYLPSVTSNACRNVKFRSCSAWIICCDWMRSSSVRQMSTSAMESVLRRRAVSGADVCGMMPRKIRFPSSLHDNGVRSLTTNPFGNPVAEGSSFEAAISGSSIIVTQVRQRQQDIVTLAHPLDGASLQDRDAISIVAPRQAVVLQRVVIEHVSPTAADVDHEQAIAVAHLRIHGVGKQVSLPVERDVADRTEEE